MEPLNPQETARALILAPRIEAMTLDKVAAMIPSVMNDIAPDQGVMGTDVLTRAAFIVLTAYNMHMNAIVRREWENYQRDGSVPSIMIHKIIEKMNPVPGRPVTPLQTEDTRPLPLKRIEDLERRVKAIEDAANHGYQFRDA